MQIAQQRRLHQKDCQNQHDARAQRSQHRRRLVPWTVKIGQPVAQERRQAQPYAVEQKAQCAQRSSGQRQQDYQRNGEQQCKPAAYRDRIRERPGDPAESGNHYY